MSARPLVPCQNGKTSAVIEVVSRARNFEKAKQEQERYVVRRKEDRAADGDQQ